jgi:hypothetical protein
MTELKPSGQVRKTAVTIKNRALIVELFPGYLTIREARRKVAYPINWHSIFVAAARIAADHAREEREKARKAKKKETIR